MRIDRSGRYRFILDSPNGLEHVITRHHLPGVTKQEECQFELAVGQLYLFAARDVNDEDVSTAVVVERSQSFVGCWFVEVPRYDYRITSCFR